LQRSKSQLAVEHAIRTQEQSPETCVFWIHASNAARYQQSLREVADCVKIPGREDPKADLPKLVQDWLIECKRKWLLVVDNLDDAQFLLQPSTTNREDTCKPLVRYLPACEYGSILVTSRTRDASSEVAEWKDTVEVSPMNETHASALLVKKLGTEQAAGSEGSKTQDVAHLVAALDYMPLAIVQAAAYISYMMPPYSVADYLADYGKGESKQRQLLKHDKGQLRRDWEAKNSILVTLQLTFDQLWKVNPGASRLMSLMSCFDRQDIPANLLRDGVLLGSNIGNQPQLAPATEVTDQVNSFPQSSRDDTFDGDMATLRSFCLISAKIGRLSYTMHALVQLAMQIWLEDKKTCMSWRLVFLNVLDTAFPRPSEDRIRAVGGPLFLHVLVAETQQPGDDENLSTWARLLTHAALHALRRGSANEAERLAKKGMEAHRRLYGLLNDRTALSVFVVATAYSLQGRREEATELHLKLLDERKELLGTKHKDTIHSMIFLAREYISQGWRDAAERLLLEVLCMDLEENDPNKTYCQRSLAILYRDQGRWTDAVKLGEELLRKKSSRFGLDDHDTLEAQIEMANTYAEVGRIADAKTLLVEVFDKRKTRDGLFIELANGGASNLAWIYLQEGRFEEAGKLYIEILGSREMIGEIESLNVFAIKSQLALTYSELGRIEDTQRLLVESWQAMRTSSIFNTKGRLRHLLVPILTMYKIGKRAEAIDMMDKYVQKRQEIFSDDDPGLIKARGWLEKWKAETTGQEGTDQEGSQRGETVLGKRKLESTDSTEEEM
jgi:tetratricopeptide (TPR) repeat protein